MVNNNDSSQRTPTIAVAIPCLNEAASIVQVVADFRKALPQASIHVFDNGSTDDSVRMARDAGALVHPVPQRGKGHVTRAILNTLRADAVLIVDGDNTYFAEEARLLLEPVLRGEADMVVGNRLPSATDQSLRRLHQFGNRLITGSINLMFHASFRDILSGYRALSRRFVETIPLLTTGFEIETELTLRALTDELPVLEVPVSYRARPVDSPSKLRSFRDGYRIMITAAILLRDFHPLRIFGGLGILLGLVALGALSLRLFAYLGLCGVSTSLTTGLLLLFAPLSALSVSTGLVLNAINTRFREIHQLRYRSGKTND